MKRFFLIIMFLLASFSLLGQTDYEVYQPWKIENEGEWGSFYWQVVRSVDSDDVGYYYFYVYLYSNSYFNRKSDYYNYDKAITYITDIKLTLIEIYDSGQTTEVELEMPFSLCDFKAVSVAYFLSTNKNSIITLEFEDASAWDSSIAQQNE